jgi:hypothetical protein
MQDTFRDGRPLLTWYHVWNIAQPQAHVYLAKDVDHLLDLAQAEIDRLQGELHAHAIRDRHTLSGTAV